MLDDDDLVDNEGTFSSAVSTLALSGTFLPPRRPSSAVISELGAAILDAASERVGREAAENDGMDGADPRAGEHRVGRLGDHRQIDRDPVALLDAMRLQHIGEAADALVQLAIGDVAAAEGSSPSQMIAT